MLNRYALIKKFFVQHNAVFAISAPVERLISFAGMITRPHRIKHSKSCCFSRPTIDLVLWN